MQRHRKFPIFTLFMVFLLVVAGVVLFLTISGHPASPFISYQVTYDDSLTEEEKTKLQNYFETHSPTADMTISAISETEYDKENDHQVLYSTMLPVADFYSPESNLTKAEAQNPDGQTISLIPLSELTPKNKLLAIDGQYFLDSVAGDSPKITGAVFRIFNINSDNKNAATETAAKLQSEFSSLPTKSDILTFTQTGVTALTRQMQNKLNAVGDAGYFSAKIADFLSSADYTHTSNEVSFASDCNNNTPMAFCSDYRMFDVLSNSGVDVVELTGNHNNDWGASANISTIDFYHEKGIKTVGGGKTEEDASVPLDISDKNTNITLIAVNNSTSTKANGQGASGDHPGANIYNESTTLSQIKEAKDKGNFVIVDIQFFECYSYPDDGEEMPSCDLPISGQEEFFKKLADAGADIVVGTQAHQPQTYELYKEKPIYYGLGNLFFDQYQWPGTMRSLVLTHYFKDGKLLQTKVTPTMYDRNFQTAVMDDASAYNYLKRLTSYY